jgi:Uma2 family endonuclease
MAEAAIELALTVHDYMGMPQGPPYFELIEGDLYMSPSPSWHHQQISVNIEEIIQAYLRNNPIGRLLHAPLDVCLSEINVYQPDVLFFTNARKSILGKRCIEGAPDFVVEILSESTAHLDKGQKRKIYARTGVKELWLIDPDLKEIAVFELKKNAETPTATYSGDDTFGSPMFPELKFSCSEVFRNI